MHMFVRSCVCVYLMVERRRNFNIFFIEISFFFHLWLSVRWYNQQISVIYNYSFERSHASEWSCNIYDLTETRNWTVIYKMRSQWLSIFFFLFSLSIISSSFLSNYSLQRASSFSIYERIAYRVARLFIKKYWKTSIKIVNYDYIINLEQSAVEQTRQ